MAQKIFGIKDLQEEFFCLICKGFLGALIRNFRILNFPKTITYKPGTFKAGKVVFFTKVH